MLSKPEFLQSFEKMEEMRLESDALADEVAARTSFRQTCPLKSNNPIFAKALQTDDNRDAISRLIQHASDIPDLTDFDQIARGQLAMCKYAVPALMFGLFHYSLIGGVTAPRVNATLIATGYLSKSSAFKRLLETTL